MPPLQEMIDAIVAEYRTALEAPLRGVTSDGRIVPGLFGTRQGVVDTGPLREAATEAWGWQFDGHHLNVNCFVLGDEIVMTPTFMESEPCKVTSGALAGNRGVRLRTAGRY